MSNTAHEGADTGTDIQTGPALKIGFIVLSVTAAVIATLVLFAVSQTPVDTTVNAANTPAAVAQRIQKVGTVAVRDNASGVLRTGEEVFKGTCTACHTSGVAGAPKIGDAAAWALRIGAGYAALLQSALKGKNAMSPQGGGEYNDIEIGRAVVYMANAGGAKFAEPAVPVSAASAGAASAAK